MAELLLRVLRVFGMGVGSLSPIITTKRVGSPIIIIRRVVFIAIVIVLIILLPLSFLILLTSLRGFIYPLIIITLYL